MSRLHRGNALKGMTWLPVEYSALTARFTYPEGRSTGTRQFMTMQRSLIERSCSDLKKTWSQVAYTFTYSLSQKAYIERDVAFMVLAT